MFVALRKLARDEDGAALVEYGLLLVLIMIICVLVVRGLGTKVSNALSLVNSGLP